MVVSRHKLRELIDCVKIQKKLKELPLMRKDLVLTVYDGINGESSATETYILKNCIPIKFKISLSLV